MVSAFTVVAARPALAATYQIGAGKLAGFAQLPALKPGDVVEVDGGASYGAVLLKDNGTAAQKITIRGLRVGGKRPVLNGGVNTLDIAGSHVVIEGFDITGGSSRCVFHRANDVTLRDSVIHDCPAHGLLGADNGSGSLLMEYVEVHHCGAGDQKHQIYMATDEVAYPGSVFRMQFCYLHDGNGGHGVKSRAERNEIYYNWIEGSYYHELELIGPDPSAGADENLAREDSDVVGNVLRKSGLRPGGHVARIGGDGTGESNGRYRFVNNTILLGQGAGVAIRVFDKVDTVEAYNNVVFRVGGGAVETIRTTEAALPLPMIAGSNNWLAAGSATPAGWTGTIQGTDPAFAAMASKDLHPASSSALVDGGAVTVLGISVRLFPSPLAAPMFEPPPGAAIPMGSAVARARSGAIDIGAYELGGAMPPVVMPPPPTPPAMPPAAPPSTTPPATMPPATTPPTTTPPTSEPTTPPPTTGTPPGSGSSPATPPTSNPAPSTGGTTGPGTSMPTPESGAGRGGIPATTGDAPGVPPGTSDKQAGAGGCTVGGAGRTPAVWLLALGLVVVRRRRRR